MRLRSQYLPEGDIKMYISIKNGQEAENLVKTLEEHQTEVEYRKGDHISFVEADLEKSNLFAILRVYANELLIFEAGIEGKSVFRFPLDKLDCIYDL